MDNHREQLREKIFSKFQKDSWELKTIGEIATEIISGSEINRDQLDAGDHPAIRAGDINSFLPIKFTECISFVDEKSIKDKKIFRHGDILISNIGNKVSKVGIATAYLGEKEGFAGVGVNIIKHNQNPIYLSYALSSKFAKAEIKRLAKKSTVYRLYPSTIKKLKIPLPPLEIQNQIVNFLDKFLDLEIEWKKESEKRKDQYEYYRELLFSRGLEEHNWPLMSIEEIVVEEMYRGIGASKDQLGTGDHPAIKCGDINTSLPLVFTKCVSFVNADLLEKKKYFEHGDILIGAIKNSEAVGKAVAYLGKEKCLLGNSVYVLKHKQKPKYLAYALSSDFVRKQIKKLTQKSTVFVLYLKDLKQIKVPVPSLEEQERIVETLDKLYRIVHDFKEGIPFLIRKNREQYEFYRELLLEK